MAQKFANAARGELLSTINDSDAALEIVEGGSLFPVANTGSSAISSSADWFKLVLQDDEGVEIVFVRTHTSGSTTFSNILRGQEGTTAREFLAGSVVGLRPTAGDAESYATDDELSAVSTAKQDRHTFADSAPSSPVNGQVWTSGVDGIEYTWLEDGASGQWVELGPSGLSSIEVGWADISDKPAVIAAGADAAAARTVIDALPATNPSITGTITEDVYAITDGAGVTIDPANGSIQTWTLGANRTPTLTSIAAGQALTLEITAGAYTITWTGVTWVKVGGSGTAPTLSTTGVSTVVLWKVGSTLKGCYPGST